MFGLITTSSASATLSAIKGAMDFVGFTVDGVVKSVKPAFSNFLGYSQSELIGLTYTKLSADGSGGPTFSALGQGKKVAGQFGFLSKAGFVVWLNGSFLPLVRRGKTASIALAAVDITESKVKADDCLEEGQYRGENDRSDHPAERCDGLARRRSPPAFSFEGWCSAVIDLAAGSGRRLSPQIPSAMPSISPPIRHWSKRNEKKGSPPPAPHWNVCRRGGRERG